MEAEGVKGEVEREELEEGPGGVLVLVLLLPGGGDKGSPVLDADNLARLCGVIAPASSARQRHG